MPRTDKEGLLSRWSRLKRESAAKGVQAGEPTATPGAAAAKADVSVRENAGENDASDALPELPPLELLTPDSDFQPFMDPRVEEGVRRAALKTLFRSPVFNVTDGLDEYAGDYTKLETLTPAMVAALKHTRRTLSGQRDAPADHASADSGTVRLETGHPDTTQLTNEDRGLASRSEGHASQPQGDGGESGNDSPGSERTDGTGAVIALEDADAGSAGSSSSEKPGGQAGSKPNA